MTLLIFVALLLVLPAAAQAQTPRFVTRGGTSFLWLPPAMQAELWAADSTFAPFVEADYVPDLVAQYPVDSRARPYAVIADFNGDGPDDVVIDGQSPTQAARIVLLSMESGYRALMLEQRLREPRQAPGQRTVYLSHVAPGRVDSSPELEDTAIVLQYEAFQVGYWEQAAVLYYWNGQVFAEYVTGD